VGNAFARVEQRRPDLRFPLPERFGKRLEGRTVEALDRRAKYLLARLDDGEVLVMHLGMTGRFAIDKANGATAAPGSFAHPKKAIPKHEHIVFHLGDGSAVRYSDVRRFGIMDLIPGATLDSHALFKGLGVEPLSDALTPEWLAAKFKGKATPIKAALLDQRLIAGIGNIYACEALHRAAIGPRRGASTLSPAERTRLAEAIHAVLDRAVEQRGTTISDFRDLDDRPGSYGSELRVYDRAGEPCLRCGRIIRRIVQGGRSTYYCPGCQTRAAAALAPPTAPRRARPGGRPRP
jgi:formamidopyrimidine-DNA glycosylase